MKGLHGPPAAAVNPQASAFSKRNPTVKLALLFAVSCALLLVTDPVTPTVLYLVAVAALLGSRTMGLAALLRAQLPFVAFAVSIVIVNVLTRPGVEQVVLGPISVSRVGLEIGWSFAARALVIGVLSIAFIQSTDPARLMVSLHQHARLPEQMTYAVLAATRLLEDLPGLLQTVRLANAAISSWTPTGAAGQKVAPHHGGRRFHRPSGQFAAGRTTRDGVANPGAWFRDANHFAAGRIDAGRCRIGHRGRDGDCRGLGAQRGDRTLGRARSFAAAGLMGE